MIIRKITNKTANFFKEIPHPIAVQAVLPFFVYENKLDNIAVFEIIKEDKTPIGVLSSFGDTSFLYLEDTTTYSFLLEAGIALFCENEIIANEKLVLDDHLISKSWCTGLVMEKEISPTQKGADKNKEQSLYNTITKAFDFLNKHQLNLKFSSFYANTHHLIRHGYANLSNVKSHHQEVVGTAMTIGLHDSYKVLQNVVVSEQEQRKGYGTLLVEKALTSANFQTVGLLCEQSLLPFYEKSKFKVVERFYKINC